MKNPLPQSYADTSQLPFNHTALETTFSLESPTAEPDQPGVWLLMQGPCILLNKKERLPDSAQAANLATHAESIYIGRWQGRPCRLRRVAGDTQCPDTLTAVNILAPEPGLPLPLLSLAGIGNAILHWEKTSRYCDNCAAEMLRLPTEWGKYCVRCHAQHYPRIHPCIIVLVRRGDEILLVRKPEWAQGRFGLVAGFVEFGENLEECVAREVREETGLEICNIRYQGSQSWPFPSQLMSGFVADYAGGEICLQEDELAEGGWYGLNRLPALPPRRSIARWLIDQAAK